MRVLVVEDERATASGNAALAESMTGQIDRMQRQIDYHLAGSRAAAAAHTPGLTCAVAVAVQRLVRALERLHAEKGLRMEQALAPDHAVACTSEDVEEMLGNLLDNACTWAQTRVHIGSGLEPAGVVITIDDDGPGLDRDLAARVVERGVRADERVPGSGLGLAIVRQIADLYGGAIVLGPSPLGGLRAQLTLRPSTRQPTPAPV